MAGIIHKSVPSTDSPPAPLAENQLTLGEAVNIVNGVLATNYRAFDKLRAVLATAQKTASEQADAERALADARARVQQAQLELEGVNKQIVAAKASLSKTAAEEANKLKAANEAAEAAKRALQADLDLQRAHFQDQLKQDALAAQTALEDRVAGLKRELGGLGKELASKQEALADLDKQLSGKTAELQAVEKKLAGANAALDALRAKL